MKVGPAWCRNLHHLVDTVHDLTTRGVGLKVLTGQGAAIDTTTAAGELVFGIFAGFERELISERTIAGLASARAACTRDVRTRTLTCSSRSAYPTGPTAPDLADGFRHPHVADQHGPTPSRIRSIK